MSFTAEEAWKTLRQTALGRDFAQSIFLSNMPRNASFIPDVRLEEKWNEIRRIREGVQKFLEEAREKKIIGSSLEAKVIFSTNDPSTRAFLEETKSLWPEIAIVSQVEVKDGTDPLFVEVVHATGHKCARCWQWKDEVGTLAPHHDICARCADVLEKEHLTVEEPEQVNA